MHDDLLLPSAEPEIAVLVGFHHRVPDYAGRPASVASGTSISLPILTS